MGVRDFVYRSSDADPKPNWDGAYPQVPIDANNPLGFSETAFFRIDIKNKYALHSRRFRADGTWSFEGLTGQACDSDQSMLMIVPARGPSLSRANAWWLPSYRVSVNGRPHTRRMQQPVELHRYATIAHIERVGKHA